MKGGRDNDNKVMGPLFPRLHVNDADKGGPRAPPRNKMALYEQLSIPSHRFNHASVPTFPLPPRNAGTSEPSASSRQGGGHERSVISPYYLPSQTPSHSTEKLHPHSSDGKYIDSSRFEIERKSAKHETHRSSNASIHLQPARRGFSGSKNSCSPEIEDDDDFRVPTFLHLDNDHQRATEKPPSSEKNPIKSAADTHIPSEQLPKAHASPPERIVITDTKSKKHERCIEQNADALPRKEQRENPINLGLGGNSSELLTIHKASYDQENVNTAANGLEKPRNVNKRLWQVSVYNGDLGATRCSIDTEAAEMRDSPGVKNGSVFKTSNGNNPGNHSATKGNRENVNKVSGIHNQRDLERNDEVSETSMVDSVSGFDISPDDVVGVIGPKHFWKARRAIVNQQRMFAVQVFELHRLIKVQKLIAASPHLLLEGNPYIHGSPKVPPKNQSSEHIVKSHPQIVKQKDDSQKANNHGCSRENIPGARPLSSPEDGLHKGAIGLAPQSGPYPGTPPPVSVTYENRPNPWCFHPHGNPWLIPVMSPSEGLVFKPIMGPCPPIAGFMAPVYGGCDPLAMPQVTRDFMNAAYGVPASHQQQNDGILSGNPAVAPNYFPAAHGLPVMNPAISMSAVDQARPSTGPPSNIQVEQHSQSSCNTSNPRTEAFSGHIRKFHSKHNELQGSTASSPSEKAQEGTDGLAFIPIPPASESTAQPLGDNDRECQTRVIKVVPHNARLATESAARIFRSIQEGRQQYD